MRSLRLLQHHRHFDHAAPGVRLRYRRSDLRLRICTALVGPIDFLLRRLLSASAWSGLWGYFTLAPFMRRTIEPFLKNTIGEVPIIGALFQGPATGRNYLTAGVILAIMITPTILSISREIITQVPRLQKEGVMALGATKWETIRYSILPYARGGIIGAAMLGLARAIGETMAVTMVIGNSSTGRITPSLLIQGRPSPVRLPISTAIPLMRCITPR
ncbi:MAG: ABC transporter permease subunit [Anaerolineae bacterium]